MEPCYLETSLQSLRWLLQVLEVNESKWQYSPNIRYPVKTKQTWMINVLLFAQLQLRSSQPLQPPDFLMPSAQYKLACSPVSHTKPSACPHAKAQPVSHRPGEPSIPTLVSGEHHYPGTWLLSLCIGSDPQQSCTQLSMRKSFYPSEPQLQAWKCGFLQEMLPEHHFHPHCCSWLTCISLPSVGEVP